MSLTQQRGVNAIYTMVQAMLRLVARSPEGAFWRPIVGGALAPDGRLRMLTAHLDVHYRGSPRDSNEPRVSLHEHST